MEREEFIKAATAQPASDPNVMTGDNAASWMAAQAGGA